jgi:hypothetical protein
MNGRDLAGAPRTGATRPPAATRAGARDAAPAQLKAAKLPTPELEVVFAPDRKWAFDYAWRPWMIALEVEGGVFVKSRHTSGLGYTNDCEKYNAAAILGWLLIRATTAMVDDGRAIDALRAAFSARGLE